MLEYLEGSTGYQILVNMNGLHLVCWQQGVASFWREPNSLTGSEKRCFSVFTGVILPSSSFTWSKGKVCFLAIFPTLSNILQFFTDGCWSVIVLFFFGILQTHQKISHHLLYGRFLVAKFINVQFIHQIANSFIKRKKYTHRACPMNQFYVAYGH